MLELITGQSSMGNLPTANDLMSLPHRRAMDLLFEKVDDALWEWHYSNDKAKLAAWLKGLSADNLDIQMIVGVLSITLPIKHWPERQVWAIEAANVIRSRENDPRRIKRLLSGLVEV